MSPCAPVEPRDSFKQSSSGARNCRQPYGNYKGAVRPVAPARGGPAWPSRIPPGEAPSPVNSLQEQVSLVVGVGKEKRPPALLL